MEEGALLVEEVPGSSPGPPTTPLNSALATGHDHHGDDATTLAPAAASANDCSPPAAEDPASNSASNLDDIYAGTEGIGGQHAKENVHNSTSYLT